MGEYVCELPVEGMLSFVSGTAEIPVREHLVRCKDCEHFDPIIHACKRFDSLCGDYVSYVFDEGFCAWGVRRNA